MSSDWCSRIANGTRINELALPGTHDAAAWTHYWNVPSSTPGTWAQRKSITEQLDMGVRVLDLRIGWTRGWTWYIGMFHGPVYLNLTLQDVLTDIRNWLARHTQEFVILVFQQQGKASKADLANEVRTMLRDTFGVSLYPFVSTAAYWPTVGELRGRVMALGRLQSDVAGFCNVRTWLSTGDNTDGVVIDAGTQLRIYLQDRYKGLSGDSGYHSMVQDNRQKFAKVRAAARANPPVPPWQLLRVNHMSYSNLRYQPWQSGEGMNKLLRDSMMRLNGVLMIDDADQSTVNYILINNSQWR